MSLNSFDLVQTSSSSTCPSVTNLLRSGVMWCGCSRGNLCSGRDLCSRGGV